MKRHRDREIAVSTLYSLDFNGNLVPGAEFDPYQGMNEEEVSSLGEDDKVFIRFLVYGTLENLEGIAKGFDGVENAYAIQAGRELRILVNADSVSDEKSREIATGIAQRIEAELRYPGKIKVTIIRELRVVEYAR